MASRTGMDRIARLRTRPSWAVVWVALFLTGGARGEAARVYDINLPAEAVADALNGLSEQTGIPILFSYDLVKGRTSHPIVGRYTLQETLDLLLKGAGLSGGLSDKGVLTISPSVPHAEITGETSLRQNNDRDKWRRSEAAFMTSSDDGQQLEEIKVTARKREERAQDVPASIMAASSQTLSDLNIVSMTELGTIAPGLTFVTDPGRFGGGPAIALRGISTLTQSFAVQDSVGTVIDGIPISRAKPGAFPDLSDVAQVEVLPGPQGTLFGKNATAGVISVTTKEPTDYFETQGDLDYSTHEDFILRAAISGPLVPDTLVGRLSLYDKSRDGYIEDNYNGSKWDDDHQKGARGKLVYTPTALDQLKLSTDFLQENDDAGMETIREFLPTTPQYLRTYLGSLVWDHNAGISANSTGANVQRADGGALQWEHRIGSHTLTTIAGYREWTMNSDSGTYNWPTPLNGAPGFGGNTLFKINSHQYSGEVRIAAPTGRRIDYVAGLFIYDDAIATSLFDPLPGLLSLSPTGALLGRQQRNWANDTKSFNRAVFGEANTHISDRLTLTTGLRWTREKVDASLQGLPTDPGLQRLVVPLENVVASETGNNLSWRAGLQWRFDADRMLYVSGATGWKGPAFNLVSSIPNNLQPVLPESSTSYEIGWKSQLLSRRVTFNLDLYHAIYRNYQTQGFVFIPGTQVATVALDNAARLRTQGVETQLSTRITDTTEISMNATYIDATFQRFSNAQCYADQPVGPGECVNGEQNLTGKRISNTPRWAYTARARQNFPVPGTSWNGFITVDYSWRSSVQWDPLDSPYGIEPAYGLVGAAIGIQSDSRYGIKFYGKNLGNTFHTEGLLIGQAVSQFLPVDYRRILGVDVFFRF